MSALRALATEALVDALREACERGSVNPAAEALDTVSGKLHARTLEAQTVLTNADAEAALAPLRALADLFVASAPPAAATKEDAFVQLSPLLLAARGYNESGSQERAMAYLKARLRSS